MGSWTIYSSYKPVFWTGILKKKKHELFKTISEHYTWNRSEEYSCFRDSLKVSVVGYWPVAELSSSLFVCSSSSSHWVGWLSPTVVKNLRYWAMMVSHYRSAVKQCLKQTNTDFSLTRFILFWMMHINVCQNSAKTMVLVLTKTLANAYVECCLSNLLILFSYVLQHYGTPLNLIQAWQKNHQPIYIIFSTM